MFENSQETAAAIEDGTYFREARRWYATVYMSVISERYFFLVLTSFAVLTAILALLSVQSLLPLNPRMPFLYQAKDAYNQIPVIKPIKTYASQDINDALRRFFIVQYISRREGYTSQSVDERLNFIRNHSNEDVYGHFASYLDMTNPHSPLQKLGNLYSMNATVDPATIDIEPVEGKPGTFTVRADYTVDLYSQKLEQTLNFRADVVIAYKDLIVSQTTVMDDGEFQITPMEFKVTEYRFKKKNG